MNSWNGFDFFVFLVFFVNTMLGIARGASKEIVSFMCLSVALIFMIKFTIPLTNWLIGSTTFQNVLDSSFIQKLVANFLNQSLTGLVLRQLTYCVSLLVCFVGAFSAGEAVLNKTGFIETMSFPYATLNRKVGGGLGFIRGYVVSVIFMLIVSILTSSNPMRDSYFMNLFSGTVSKFEQYIGLQKPENYRRLYEDKGLYNVNEIYKVASDASDLQNAPNAPGLPAPTQPSPNNSSTQ